MLSVIIGRRRQGKSTLAFRLALTEQKTIIVFDPNNQYEALPVITDLAAWMESSDANSIGRIVPTNPIPDWQETAKILDGGTWEWGDYVLILDEASMLMTRSLDPSLERYARTSPKDVTIILTTHRAVDIHPTFRALTTDWYIFNQYQERDLENIADNQGPDVAAMTTQLGEYQLVHFWLGNGGAPQWKTWEDPAEWYVDIGRTT